MMLPDEKTIRSRRKKADLTQRQLAKEAGVSQSLIAKLESGKAEASYEKVKRIFETLDKAGKKEEKKCEDVMTKHIVCAKPNDKIGGIVEKMKKHAISQLPVFSGTKQVGSITDTGIVAKMEEFPNIHEKPVKEIMEEPFPTVNKGLFVSSLLPILKEAGAVLVLDKGERAGIISKSNVI